MPLLDGSSHSLVIALTKPMLLNAEWLQRLLFEAAAGPGGDELEEADELDSLKKPLWSRRPTIIPSSLAADEEGRRRPE